MSLLRRVFVSFVVLFDILGFGIIFIIMSNTSPSDQGDLNYMVEGDAVFGSVVGLVGVVANMGLALVLLRGSLATRRLEAERRPESRTRITGE
ncbi:MAG: hypothetical protein H0V37_04750 [Chloroflexia bacterium]|nr:hypothetical protein [Chloroflexia bacterium]